jgi:hypothetical protein
MAQDVVDVSWAFFMSLVVRRCIRLLSLSSAAINLVGSRCDASQALVGPGLRDEYGAVVAVHFHRLLWPAHTADDVVHLQPKTIRLLITFERKKRTYFGLRTLHWQVTWHRPMSSTHSIIRVQSNKTKKKLITFDKKKKHILLDPRVMVVLVVRVCLIVNKH